MCDGKDNDCDEYTDEGCCEVSMRVSPDSVWPLIPENQRPAGYTDDSARTMIEVSLARPAPSGGCTMELRVYGKEKSGGHDHHDALRLTGTLDKSYVHIPAGTTGPEEVKYTSPEVSGVEKVEATVKGSGRKAEAKVKVRVPGLTPLGGGFYSLKCDIQSCAGYEHEDFYNVQSWVKYWFGKIAFKYHERFPSDSLLVVADGSLSLGGLYDYQNTWKPPHNTHRIGTDIDVRSKSIPIRHRKDFERIVCTRYGMPKLEFLGQENEHYHIYFFPYKGIKETCEGEIPI